MRKTSILIAIGMMFILSGCTDDLVKEESFGHVGSRAIVAEEGEVSLSNPDLLTDWETVTKIVLNKADGGIPHKVTAPWGDGVVTALSAKFRTDVKKKDGWTMLFHTFKETVEDEGLSYICFYNLFSGIVKVFYYYDGQVTATNSRWTFGVAEDTPVRMLYVPTYLSYPDVDLLNGASYAVKVSNEPSSEVSAIQPGWNGFEFRVTQYCSELKAHKFLISAVNEVITKHEFDGSINLGTTGIITSITKTGGGGSVPVTNSVAKIAGNKTKEFIDSLYVNSTSYTAGKTAKVFKSLLNIAGNVASSGVMGAVKAGLGIIFGHTSAKTYSTISDVNLTTSGNVEIKGTSSTTTTSAITPLSFDLYDVLHGHSVSAQLLQNNKLVYKNTKLNNLGVWTLKSTPKVYWDLCSRFEPYDPNNLTIPGGPDVYGTAQGPTIQHCKCEILFNPAIQPFIKGCNVTIQPFHTYLRDVKYYPTKWSPFLNEEDVLYKGIDRTIYSADSKIFHIGMIPDFKNNIPNEATRFWFKWNLPTNYSTVVLVTVDVGISYMGNNFTISESKVFRADDVEFVNQPPHNPPFDLFLNPSERQVWVHTISRNRISF